MWGSDAEMRTVPTCKHLDVWFLRLCILLSATSHLVGHFKSKMKWATILTCLLCLVFKWRPDGLVTWRASSESGLVAALIPMWPPRSWTRRMNLPQQAVKCALKHKTFMLKTFLKERAYWATCWPERPGPGVCRLSQQPQGWMDRQTCPRDGWGSFMPTVWGRKP